MTSRQLTILEHALTLFANEGFNAVSTSRIAREAEVSEGLIFKHYRNKAGLLQAVLELCSEKATTVFQKIIEIDDAKERLRAAIEMPFSITKEEAEYWRLMYHMQWQQGNTEPPDREPLIQSITAAFRALGFKNARTEASLLMVFHDGIAKAMLLGKEKNTLQMLQVLRDKYNI